jgi:hypothetical protein
MMIYFIDNVRFKTTNLQYCNESVVIIPDGEVPNALFNCDFIFAHQNDFREDLSSDFLMNDKIKQFRVLLAEAASNRTAPILILYSGDGLNAADLSSIKLDITRNVSSEFPLERIHGVNSAIHRKSTVGEVIVKAGSVFEFNKHQGSNIRQFYDVKLALRFLCEAWLIVSQGGNERIDGVKVNAPDKKQDWFKSFGEDEPSSVAAFRIGSKIYGSQVPIDFLLTGIAEGAYTNLNDNSCGSSFATAIKELLKTLSERSS